MAQPSHHRNSSIKRKQISLKTCYFHFKTKASPKRYRSAISFLYCMITWNWKYIGKNWSFVCKDVGVANVQRGLWTLELCRKKSMENSATFHRLWSDFTISATSVAVDLSSHPSLPPSVLIIPSGLVWAAHSPLSHWYLLRDGMGAIMGERVPQQCLERLSISHRQWNRKAPRINNTPRQAGHRVSSSPRKDGGCLALVDYVPISNCFCALHPTKHADVSAR